MRKVFITAACLLFVSGIIGCESSGISPRDPAGTHTDNTLSQLFDPTTQRASHDPERIKTPAHLAVAQIGEISPPDVMIAELKKSTVFSSVESMPAPMPATYRSAENIDAYRSMAAAQKADYLLIVGGKADTLQEPTPLCVLDATILGMFVIPSQMLHADVKAVGAIMDVHNGESIALRTADATDESMIPTALVDTSRIRLLERVRDQAAVNLAQAVIDEAKR